MPLHGGEPEGRRVGKVYVWSGWPLAISLSLFLSLPANPALSLPRVPSSLRTVSRSLFPSPYLSPEPVAHKLIRSRCLLARDSHWPPVVTPLALFASSLPSPLPPAPPCTLRDQDHPFSRSPKVPNIRESYVTERSSAGESSSGGRAGRKRTLGPLTNHSPRLAILRDPLPR